MITKVELNVIRNRLVAKSGAFERFTIQVFAFKALRRRNLNMTYPRGVHVNNLPLFLYHSVRRYAIPTCALRLKNNLTDALPSVFQDILDLLHLVLVEVMVIGKDPP
ncbi:MAG: hypothetical protein ACXVIP_04805, partial [Halobacteriota archaeon]